MFEIGVATSRDEFLALRSEWNPLLEASQSVSPFLTWEWMAACEKTLVNSTLQPFVLYLRGKEKELVAIAPFWLRSERKFGMKFDIVEFIGGDERICADYLDIICAPSFRNEVPKSIFDFLDGGQANKWDLIRMSGIQRDSLSWELGELFRQRSYDTWEQFLSYCPYIPLPSSWEEYLDSLSKKSRYNVRKKRKTLDSKFANRFFLLKDKETLSPAMARLHELHAKRMGMKEVEGFSVDPRFWELQKEAAEGFLENGRLFLGLLEVENMPVAAQYAFIYKNRVFHYQTGLDPEHEKYSVGLISTGYLIEEAIRQGASEYDFLRGEEDYKEHWAKDKKEIFAVTVASSTYKGRFYLAEQKALSAVKSGARKFIKDS
jgi:CelD/BcsL family acetyltransferase involved in cellulose biosynthesis